MSSIFLPELVSYLLSRMGKRAPCAMVFLQLLLFIMLFCSQNSISTDSINQSQGISVGQTLISSSQVFELGFFSPGNSGKQYVGIWYYNISKVKPVWVANRESPIPITDNSSSLSIGDDGNLKILDGKGNMVWSTNISSPSNDTVAVLSDQGKLTLEDSVKKASLWDSFSYPGDTFIVGMSLSAKRKTGENHFLSSWKSEDDPSVGNYTYGITTEIPPQTFVWENSKRYRRSGPWDGWKFIGLHNTGKGYANGLLVAEDNQQGIAYLSYYAQSESDIVVITLAFDGDVRRSLWNIDSSEGVVIWIARQLACDIYATCGPFGYCDRVKTKTCKCLKGYVPKSTAEWNNKNWTNGCVLRTELPCQRNITTSLSDKAKSDGFWQLSEMKVPDHHIYMYGLDASSCQKWCLYNCSCRAYAYPDGIGCLVWVGDLLDVQQFEGYGADIFVRVAYSELVGHKKMMKLVTVLTTVSGAILLAAFIWALRQYAANRRVLRRRRIDPIVYGGPVGPPIRGTRGDNLTQREPSELPMFEFTTLAVATNNFSETNKLGEGGFGPVYRGKLENGQEMAVKRLSCHSGQGAVEFKNEILLISGLKHRNLVTLLGFCIEGNEKLLVYEYLKNKSLDTLLFDTSKKVQLDWSKRFNIIVGIARGLLYLHQDSCLRIIHRDLKAGNILLDDDMNPKISDFGLARAFHITQELTNTQRVVGTLGYISPEYAAGGLFSEKSDVYSFGVLVLEIISGMEITSFRYEEKYVNLQGHAWHLWEKGKGLDLMDDQLSTSYSESEFMKCLQIGLLCVQDHAVDRPTMSSVVLMLSSDTPIPQSKQPMLCQDLMSSAHYLNNLFSINGVSLSVIEGR